MSVAKPIIAVMLMIWSTVASAQIAQTGHPRTSPEEVEYAGRGQAIHPGVMYRKMEPRDRRASLEWSISLGVFRNEGELRPVLACAQHLGLPIRREAHAWEGPQGMAYGEVLAGTFPSMQEAAAALEEHPLPRDCPARVVPLALYPDGSEWPWLVHVVEIDPRSFAGRLEVAQGLGQVAGRSPTSRIASENNAIAAVNGGFFVMQEHEGVVGEPTSVSIAEGRMLSEPTWGRPWFAIRNGDLVSASLEASIEHITPILRWNDGTSLTLDGVNRRPELLRNCGALRDPQDRLSWHDQTCLMQDQLVALDESAGFLPDRYRNVLYVMVRSDGSLVERYAAPGKGELLLVATGSRIAELRARLERGDRARLSVALIDAEPEISAIGGGPTLLKEGRKVYRGSSEGWPFAHATWDQANAMHGWVTLKNPRTAIGVRSDGTILLVVVDGWRFRDGKPSPVQIDGGATIEELRDIMLALGAVDAMNLDGGGSSTLVLMGEVANHPSDESGERPVGDALVLIPAAK